MPSLPEQQAQTPLIGSAREECQPQGESDGFALAYPRTQHTKKDLILEPVPQQPFYQGHPLPSKGAQVFLRELASVSGYNPISVLPDGN